MAVTAVIFMPLPPEGIIFLDCPVIPIVHLFVHSFIYPVIYFYHNILWMAWNFDKTDS